MARLYLCCLNEVVKEKSLSSNFRSALLSNHIVLDLAINEIKNEGAATPAEVLLINTLTDLNLDNNRKKPRVIKALTGVLEIDITLINLDFCVQFQVTKGDFDFGPYQSWFEQVFQVLIRPK